MTKVFVGGRLRRMREDRGYTQVGMARELGLSASYYNQIENDERPLTAQLIVRVSELLKVDAQLFADDQEGRLIADMREALVAGAPEEDVSLADLREVASSMPALARVLIKIQHRHRQALERVDLLSHKLVGARDAHAVSLPLMPHEEVRDFFYARSNYIDELDRAAEKIASEEDLRPGETFDALARRLAKLHGVTVAIERPDGERTSDGSVLQRRFQKGSLVLSPSLTPTQRAFQIATQLAFLEAKDMLKKLAAEGSFTSDESRALARIGLAHHFAGALLMPYRAFLAAAEQLRYDLDPLRRRFGVSYEMVCHRVSTLQRPGAQGVPFFFLRVDRAGNISKRQSATDFHFSRVGGTCPLWNVYEAFAQPGRTLVQPAQMPDGRTYLWIARAVSRGYGGYGSPSKTFSIALGCDVRHASRLVYSQGIDLRAPGAVTPIGMGCKVCDRPACPQRAFPQMGRHVVVDESRSHFEPYFALPVVKAGVS